MRELRKSEEIIGWLNSGAYTPQALCGILGVPMARLRRFKSGNFSRNEWRVYHRMVSYYMDAEN